MVLNTDQSGLLLLLLANLNPDIWMNPLNLTDDLKMIVQYDDEAVDFLKDNDIYFEFEPNNGTLVIQL